jgi:hypothetical protein
LTSPDDIADAVRLILPASGSQGGRDDLPPGT